MNAMNKYELSVTGEFREKIWQPFLDGIKKYELIQPNDRIAVCISGGKDSMLTGLCMQLLQRSGDTQRSSGLQTAHRRGTGDRKDTVFVCGSRYCQLRPAQILRTFAVSHDRKNALSSWRLSLSHLTAEDEIGEFLKALNEIIHEKT